MNNGSKMDLALGDRLNSSYLKSFSINGLFGYKDVKIPFEKEALILISENGFGKTIVLDTLYYSISGQYYKLSNIEFESVVIEFISGKVVEIKKEDLKLPFNKDFSSKAIQSASKESILYFTADRRAEKELQNLGYDFTPFGMLVSLYQQKKKIDNPLNRFVQICNKYLYKKKIVYDEDNVDISIIETRNNSLIDFSNLSSGEKQIVSIFGKIYLDPSEDIIVLFDEPELSLSIEWQASLFPDILKSNKVKLLLATTHSPFIFDNELGQNAQDLGTFVWES
ncbi:MAG: ATP-binding protein [Okeania sp. SIO2H7]|nr:ATP-binding protein [Okeania sp. SIO2H7]